MKYWDKAWSLVEGCTPVSAACDNCWLAAMEYRFGKNDNRLATAYKVTGASPAFIGHVRCREDRLYIPLKTRKSTVFAIWSDLFHEKITDEFIRIAFNSMATDILQPCKHTYLVLTKRPERMAAFFEKHTTQGTLPWPNVYLGTTVENQETADKRIPELLKVPGKKFLSVEPMLGPINIFERRAKSGEQILPDYPGIDAVICGGESGSGARPMHPEWVRSLRDQCQAAGVPFTFKQWGEWASTPDLKTKIGDICMSEDGDIYTVDKNYFCAHNESEGTWMRKQKKAGHLLDGKEYINLPWREKCT